MDILEVVDVFSTIKDLESEIEVSDARFAKLVKFTREWKMPKTQTINLYNEQGMISGTKEVEVAPAPYETTELICKVIEIIK